MDSRSASLANENKKKRGSSKEGEEVQDDSSKRSCPSSSYPLSTNSRVEIDHIVENFIDVEVNRVLGEAWTDLTSRFREQVYKEIEKNIQLQLIPRSPSLRIINRKQHENERGVTIGFGYAFGALKPELVFCNSIPPRIFANDEIKSENGVPLKVAICDPNNCNAVISTGPLSSAPIEFFPLDGELKEIVKSRKGKPSSLITCSDPKLYLQKGVCLIERMFVTDNSSWTMSKKFRLGVKITDEKILSDFGMIEQAISQPFKVLDDRMKGSEKHHPPSWDDEVSRLEGIGGTYQKVLSSLEPPIITVGNFLEAYRQMGPIDLKKILGMTKSDKKWNKILNHAMECVLDVPTNYDQTFQANNSNQNLEFNQQNQNLETINEVVEANSNNNNNDELPEDLRSAINFDLQPSPLGHIELGA